MSMGKMAAGKPPASKKEPVQVVKVESLDTNGSSFSPNRYKYWVVDLNIPPNVIRGDFNSWEEAEKWVVASGEYELSSVPAPK